MTTILKQGIMRRNFLAGLSTAAFAGLCDEADASSRRLSILWFDWQPWNDASVKVFKNTVYKPELRPTIFSDIDRLVRSTPDQPEPFDLVMVDGPNIPTYVAAGLLEPATAAFKTELSDFLPSPRRAAMVGGEFYGPAMDDSSQALWFNKEILDRYNIQPPTTLENAWKWDHAREIFIEVQAKERERRKTDRFWALLIGQAGQPGGGTYTGLNISRSSDSVGSPTFQAISANGLNVRGYIDTHQAIKAYHFIQGLYNIDNLVPRSSGSDFFANEQCAFWLAAVSRRKTFKIANPSLQAGVTPHPYFEAPIVQTGSFHLAVSNFSRQKENALQLLKEIASADNLEIMAKAAGDFPSRRSILPRFPEFNEQPLSIFQETVLKWGHPAPQTPGYAEYSIAIDSMLREIAAGSNVEDTVSSTVDMLEYRLQRYKNFQKKLGE